MHAFLRVPTEFSRNPGLYELAAVRPEPRQAQRQRRRFLLARSVQRVKLCGFHLLTLLEIEWR